MDGKTLYDERRRLKVTQQELADAMGWHFRTLSAIEKGQLSVVPEQLEQAKAAIKSIVEARNAA